MQPMPVKPEFSGANVGEELVGVLPKSEVTRIINKFAITQQVFSLALENQLTGKKVIRCYNCR